MENNSRFVTREMTVRELIYLYKSSHGDFEAMAELIKSRVTEPIDGLLDMSASEFKLLVDDCMTAINESQKISFALSAIMKSS